MRAQIPEEYSNKREFEKYKADKGKLDEFRRKKANYNENNDEK